MGERRETSQSMVKTFFYQVQQGISDVVTTQAFREVVWVALMRPIPELAEVQGRMADLFPGDIQDWNGNLRCSTVCSLVMLVSPFSVLAEQWRNSCSIRFTRPLLMSYTCRRSTWKRPGYIPGSWLLAMGCIYAQSNSSPSPKRSKSYLPYGQCPSHKFWSCSLSVCAQGSKCLRYGYQERSPESNHDTGSEVGKDLGQYFTHTDQWYRPGFPSSLRAIFIPGS